jgi:hypothetical protein
MVETRQICAGVTGAQATSVTSSRSTMTSAPMTVAGLQKMNRAELIELFMHQCEAPRSIEEIEGQWNGVLLKNNGLVSEFARDKNELADRPCQQQKLTPRVIAQFVCCFVFFSFWALLIDRCHSFHHQSTVWQRTRMEWKTV